VNKVPIGRYIVFVGSLLLAMLFVADWLVPMGATQSVTSRKADKPIISIKSDHKWPERIAFDTSAPTIVAQMPPVVAVTPVTNHPREAFALLSAPVPEVSETPLPVRTKRKVAKRAPHSRWTAYRPAARAEALPAGWWFDNAVARIAPPIWYQRAR
jgi:Zn-dependent protease with chaperone function